MSWSECCGCVIAFPAACHQHMMDKSSVFVISDVYVLLFYA